MSFLRSHSIGAPTDTDHQTKPMASHHNDDDTITDTHYHHSSVHAIVQQQPAPPMPQVNRDYYMNRQGLSTTQTQSIAASTNYGPTHYSHDLSQRNPNHNQSNNNDIIETNVNRRQHDEQSRSAEKILDAFERFYINRTGLTSVPMKVKYIPEDYSIDSKQRNTNNNNRSRSTSTTASDASLPSTWSNPERFYSRRFNRKTVDIVHNKLSNSIVFSCVIVLFQAAKLAGPFT
jgi:hypothetical protein